MARIIYAEDEAMMGELVQTVLMAEGHAVGVVKDGAEVLPVITRRRPDLLILDVSMPGVTGSQVLRDVRRDPELYNLPVLMLTARTSQGDEDIARVAGASDYLRKPFAPEMLASRVQALLDRKEEQEARRTPPSRGI